MVATTTTPKPKDNLWVAAGDGQLDRVKELVEEGADVNGHDENGYTAMHAAVSYNQLDIVKYLVEKGANVNVEDFDKDTPLFTTETVDMAKLLVELGADPKKKNELGLTAAMTAYDEGWEDVAEFLIDITGEELPTFEQEEEVDDLAHTQQDDDDEELTPAMNNKLQEILQKIEEQGGVDDEEKLREMVMNMLLEEMQGAGVDADDVEDEEK